MIAGVGIDIIEVERVMKACEKESFLKRIFTVNEIQLIKADRKKAADNFAVKEAVSKMFGTGFTCFAPIDIEVLRNEHGKPYVTLNGKAAALAKQQGITKIHVSISNTRDFANAFVVGENMME